MILGGIIKLLMWLQSTWSLSSLCFLKREMVILLQSTPFVNVLLRRTMEVCLKEGKDMTKTYKDEDMLVVKEFWEELHKLGKLISVGP